MAEELVVTLNRGDSSGFGFSLLGTAGLPHVIYDIIENSPAAKSGKNAKEEKASSDKDIQRPDKTHVKLALLAASNRLQVPTRRNAISLSPPVTNGSLDLQLARLDVTTRRAKRKEKKVLIKDRRLQGCRRQCASGGFYRRKRASLTFRRGLTNGVEEAS
ncbi:uncharacterized protein LOC122529889 [Frieseomelitta varia]|uniref:uncharacterized protein LOC122529889 n=1 Tax=Frieseomelitta varia TaxID=561572 RepID=UPI001CB681A6|nr:uncharacterized protein LOC122529889 [Frieseomelitta varia]XP_043512332.1 uncharacterized protein LOC122529889 [Frieseomelitta varia]